VDEGSQRTDRMQAAEQLAEAIELLQIARLRRAAAAAREQGKRKPACSNRVSPSRTSGATTGTSHSASSKVKLCSSRIAASVQRCGR